MLNQEIVKNIIESEEPDEKDALSRREFLWLGSAAVGAIYLGAIGYPVYQYLSTSAQRSAEAAAVTQTTLDGVANLPKNTALMFKFGAKPAMLIHHQDETWTAYNAVCTHLGCTVKYEPEANRISCACHGGVYDPATGANVSGPPPKPLTKYNVEVKDGNIVVSRA
ncbi:MAG TPA: Rieske (2Fe-2S) protein [Pyrinomonadaceae bacterium]|nr:Rieske (2Fe-2S) protein [Pyrinomonadaceae bacterium]